MYAQCTVYYSQCMSSPSSNTGTYPSNNQAWELSTIGPITNSGHCRLGLIGPSGTHEAVSSSQTKIIRYLFSCFEFCSSPSFWLDLISQQCSGGVKKSRSPRQHLDEQSTWNRERWIVLSFTHWFNLKIWDSGKISTNDRGQKLIPPCADWAEEVPDWGHISVRSVIMPECWHRAYRPNCHRCRRPGRSPQLTEGGCSCQHPSFFNQRIASLVQFWATWCLMLSSV